MVKHPWEGESFLYGYDIFLRFLLLSIYKKLLKVSDHFVEKICHESTTLSRIYTARELITTLEGVIELTRLENDD